MVILMTPHYVRLAAHLPKEGEYHADWKVIRNIDLESDL